MIKQKWKTLSAKIIEDGERDTEYVNKLKFTVVSLDAYQLRGPIFCQVAGEWWLTSTQLEKICVSSSSDRLFFRVLL